jgi:hypothetical protein
MGTQKVPQAQWQNTKPPLFLDCLPSPSISKCSGIKMLAAIQSAGSAIKVGKWWGASKQQKAAAENHQGEGKTESKQCKAKQTKHTKHSKTPSADVELQSFSSSRNSSQLEEQAL